MTSSLGSGGPVPTERRPHALLVDDDPGVLRSVSRVLSRSLEVTCAGDSRRVVALCEKTAFDVVVTDLEMPFVDGAELIARLRASPRFERLPIIVLTGTFVTRVPGANLVLHKPEDLPNIVATVLEVIAEASTRQATVVA